MIPWDMAEVLGYELELSRIFKFLKLVEEMKKRYDLQGAIGNRQWAGNITHSLS